ncbi:MAG TPA: hypothetical protein VMM12_12125 [Longimicrobiales bacterium]|nr:hypothetical protein [Longimicrobiales bacterium]
MDKLAALVKYSHRPSGDHASSDLRRQLEGGQMPALSPAILQAAESALTRLDARAGEDVEAWATRLAEDLSRPND